MVQPCNGCRQRGDAGQGLDRDPARPRVEFESNLARGCFEPGLEAAGFHAEAGPDRLEAGLLAGPPSKKRGVAFGCRVRAQLQELGRGEACRCCCIQVVKGAIVHLDVHTQGCAFGQPEQSVLCTVTQIELKRPVPRKVRLAEGPRLEPYSIRGTPQLARQQSPQQYATGTVAEGQDFLAEAI